MVSKQYDGALHIASVVGARPNLVKIAPLVWEFSRRGGIHHTLIHTGQHYDDVMSNSFFETLQIPKADINLGVGSGTHGVQTGRVMVELEPVLDELRPDWLLTVGDVNSTVAAALVAVKLGIPTAHVEAGLRSFDRSMPEEINRIITDSISDLLFVSEPHGLENLRREGVDEARIRFVGNVMIDTLVELLPRARDARAWERFGVEPKRYLLVTLHRPSNVDLPERLAGLCEALLEVSVRIPVLFPVHPRTLANLRRFDLEERMKGAPGVTLTEPLDYLNFLSLVTSAGALLTDSGGIQEETTYLGIPCLTLRPNTERPITVTEGTNELVAPTREGVLRAVERLLSGGWKQGKVPRFWDGKTAGRIVDVLAGEAEKHAIGDR